MPLLLRVIPDAARRHALCNDGSPAGFYYAAPEAPSEIPLSQKIARGPRLGEAFEGVLLPNFMLLLYGITRTAARSIRQDLRASQSLSQLAKS